MNQMRDQASKLREMALSLKKNIEREILNPQKKTRVIVISSGKGGVGKSTIALNLSLCIAMQGKKVVLLDADMGLANIDVMLGLVPQYNIYHVLQKQKSIYDIIMKGPENLDIIPGGSGIAELANLPEDKLRYIIQEVSKLEGFYEYMLVDTGAGISSQVLGFLLAGDEVIIVTTPEPTSFTDAYGLIKSIDQLNYKGKISLIMNKVRNDNEGILLSQKFKSVSMRFLNREINILGVIHNDSQFEDYTRRQQVLVKESPRSSLARSIKLITDKILNDDNTFDPSLTTSGMRGFFKKLMSFRF